MCSSFSLMLSLALVAGSANTQSVQAQSVDPNDFQTAVVLVKLEQPIYPPLARLARIQGDVEIMVGVRKDGSVGSVSVARGYPILGQAALQSAQNSEYECRRCSEAVNSYSLVYTFRLEESQAISVTQLGNHVTVTGELPTIVVENNDPFRFRSAKCLYLWKCGFR